MAGKIVSIKFKDLSDMSAELSRGCEYKVIARVAHKAISVGIIEAPHTEVPRIGLPYKVIPIHAFRENYFDVPQGEVGQLISTGYRDNEVEPFHARIVWKDSLQIYYTNPVAMDRHTLDTFFDLRKILPAEK